MNEKPPIFANCLGGPLDGIRLFIEQRREDAVYIPIIRNHKDADGWHEMAATAVYRKCFGGDRLQYEFTHPWVDITPIAQNGGLHNGRSSSNAQTGGPPRKNAVPSTPRVEPDGAHVAAGLQAPPASELSGESGSYARQACSESRNGD